MLFQTHNCLDIIIIIIKGRMSSLRVYVSKILKRKRKIYFFDY